MFPPPCKVERIYIRRRLERTTVARAASENVLVALYAAHGFGKQAFRRAKTVRRLSARSLTVSSSFRVASQGSDGPTRRSHNALQTMTNGALRKRVH